MARTNLCLLALILMPSTLPAQADWLAFRWHTPEGGRRDLEFDRSNVVRERAEVTVHLRRDRATTLQQDSTIAPETNPWTEAVIRLDCVARRWMMAEFRSTGADGKQKSAGQSSNWIAVQGGTLANALRERFCPST